MTMGLDKIWVFGEANGDAVATITLEMLAKARQIADTVEVFMAGDGDDYAEELGDHGQARCTPPATSTAPCRALRWPRRSQPRSRVGWPPPTPS
ncbi:MAG: hypothetical protein R2695_04940 [Acidimicrobiales bacterium]